MKLAVKKLSLNVEKRASNEPALVFLHYWGGTSRTWNAVAAQLDGKFTTVTYDMHGWGLSDKPDDGYSVADYADEAIDLIGQLGISSFVLVGHSLGGKVAQLIASKSPKGLKGVVLVASAPPSPLHFSSETRQGLLHMYDTRESIIGAVGILTARTPSAQLIEQIVADSLSGSKAAIAGFVETSSDEDITADVAKIKVPVLVIAGELDKFTPLSLHEQQTVPRIQGAKLLVLSGVGHLVPFDAPVELADEIDKFAASLAA